MELLPLRKGEQRMFEPAMRNPHATHVDFGFLRGLIPANPKAMPSNIDMVFERKAHFLFGEWKRPSENMSIGQEIVLVNLAKQPNTTVLVITGNTDNGVEVSDIQAINKYGMYVPIGKDADDLKSILNDWYVQADAL